MIPWGSPKTSRRFGAIPAVPIQDYVSMNRELHNTYWHNNTHPKYLRKEGRFRNPAISGLLNPQALESEVFGRASGRPV